MLRSLKELEGYGLHATDGELGKVKDFYFDDGSWNVRYAVVDTSKWLPGRRVLIAPASFEEPDSGRSLIPVRLSQEQVREAPTPREDQPVSRQHEAELARHYAWPSYWVLPHGQPAPVPPAVQGKTTTTMRTAARTAETKNNPRLRSANEIKGYQVRSSDGEVGPVADFIVDTGDWVLRYLVVDTRRWLPGGKVLLSPDWIDEVKWGPREVVTKLSESMIKACPPFDPSEGVNRKYEQRIYDYYGRPRYWA